MEIRALAHRGYPTKYPENTMEAYEAAYKLGFTHLELDVHLSKDNVPVLMHDITVDRMTNGNGLVKDFTLKELKQLTVGDNAKVPTLEEALLFYKDKMKVSVELKQHGDLYKDIEQIVYDVIVDTGMLNHVYVNSFDHFSIVKMREICDKIDLGVIQTGATPAVIPFMQEHNFKYLSVRLEYLTRNFVDMCTEAGIQIVTWPVDNKEQFNFVQSFPEVLCTTNELTIFKSLYEQGTEFKDLLNVF